MLNYNKMTSMKFRMTKNCPYDKKPEIGIVYKKIKYLEEGRRNLHYNQ